MTRKASFLIALAGCLLVASRAALATETKDILSKIETLASLGKKADAFLGESVAEDIENSPAAVSSALLPKLADKHASDKQVTVYVWALGLTRDPNAVTAIVDLYRRNKSDVVRGSCLSALATIGGKQAGECLMSVLDAAPNQERRFDILNLLGQMQYEPALPRTEEVLKQDPRQFYWQPVFVFGKMGDKAVPFLLKRINDKDPNIRANAIHVLGQWLIPPEAVKPLEDQFWTEKDAELRHLILSSLERTIVDLEQMKAFFEKVVAKEKDAQLVKFAGETVANTGRIRAKLLPLAQSKKASAKDFAREYSQLFKSAGHKGDYKILADSSSREDEPKLKALRERILQRNSDEAFYDYQKVNNIIIHNRLADGLKNTKASDKPNAANAK